ncbi:MAG: deoxyribodipyrimidine photo-lyase [Proteobacteria bacterium]|nr:deoxyribodipyrimidine photo-lyase [Pseudomonadota bacterium]
MTASPSAPAIVWFRQDLRLADNPALHAALKSGRPILPVYILDNITPGEWKMGAASHWWLHHSLEALAKSLKAIGLPLILKRGESGSVMNTLVKESGAGAVYWNRCYEPYATVRDATIKENLRADDIAAESYNASLLVEPWEVENAQGNHFKVFTPFWRRAVEQLLEREMKTFPYPTKANAPATLPTSDVLDEWKLLPTQPNWAEGFAHWTPGEKGAEQALLAFTDSAIRYYRVERDFPAQESTSRLSPHLHFGEISPRLIWKHVYHQLDAERIKPADAQKFLSEVGWREFSYSLLYHFPALPQKPFQEKFAAFPWEKNDKALLAWQRGMTGYPIVDAGMRELWQTGWMHNRVRMIVASFLTKHLLLPWQEGAKWFWDTLLDADLANNSASWQWVAGSGADAAPYFRIFNPILQGEKFDEKGEYIRRFVPELKNMPKEYIHAPWKAPEWILKQAKVVIGKDYPAPIVNHEMARDRALEAYKNIK